MNSQKILVIDDQTIIIHFITDILQSVSTKLELTTCRDGSEAIKLISKQNFDLIISDWNMPNLGGGDLVRALENHNLIGKECPIIFISAELENAISEFSNYEGIFFLEKSPGMAGLIETISQAEDYKGDI